MNTFRFTLFLDIDVLAHVVNNRVASVEFVKGKNIPPRVYNSYLNQANAEALKIWDYVLNVVEYAHNGNTEIIETPDFIHGVVYAYRYNEKLQDTFPIVS